MSKDFGVRDGEKAVDLPADPMPASISSAASHALERAQGLPEKRPRIRRRCTVEVDARWAAGLKDVETCSHLVLLYWMDNRRATWSCRCQAITASSTAPCLALAGPANPVAMSVVKSSKIEGNRPSVIGLDCLDGTP